MSVTESGGERFVPVGKAAKRLIMRLIGLQKNQLNQQTEHAGTG